MSDNFAQLNTELHPDAFIARNPEMREFYCIYCDESAAEEALKVCAAHAFRYRDGCVLLFDADADCVSGYEALFCERKCHAGICGPFARAVSAYGCAEKAYTAAKSGGQLYPDIFLHRYSDVRFWVFVELADKIIGGEGFSVNDFCHSRVFDICEYDRLEGSDYRATLMAYLRSGCNLRVAAEMVGVHRNTLAYRIRRLKELFDINLDEPNTCFELLFSFTALEASGIDWDNYKKAEPGEYRAAELSGVLWDLAQHRDVCELPDCICTLFMIDATELPDEETAALFCAVEERFAGTAVAYNDSYIYILAGTESRLVDVFRSVLAENGHSGVVSQPFVCSRLALQAELLSHILVIAKQMHPDDTFLMEKDYCTLSFFSYMQNRTSLEPFYCDEVIRVMDNDYKSGTAFSASLYRYLSNFTHMNGAAHDASIHRNTLEYQIKKALSVAKVSNPDDKLRFEMMCTYQMLIASGT